MPSALLEMRMCVGVYIPPLRKLPFEAHLGLPTGRAGYPNNHDRTHKNPTPCGAPLPEVLCVVRRSFNGD